MPNTKVFPHGQVPGSLELAFVGDSVYDLYVRSNLTLTGGKVNDLNCKAVLKVNARAQCESLGRIEPYLTEEEKGVVRRARNTKQTPTKNADILDYKNATALEALLGYLYLTGESERLAQLLTLSTGMEDKNVSGKLR